jgi:hypothetical protein
LLNDQLRSDPAAHGHVLFTGIMRLIDDASPRKFAATVIAQQQLIRLAGVARHFTGSDRNRAECRCGTLRYLDQLLAFDIEYRDRDALKPSRDPADPQALRWILTTGLVSECAQAG